MKLPAGTDGGTITGPQDEAFFSRLSVFRGAVEIRLAGGSGFILVDNGRMQAAMFRSANEIHKGRAALSFMTSGEGARGSQTFHLRQYNDPEFVRALDLCRASHLLIAYETLRQQPEPGTAEPSPGSRRHAAGLDEGRLRKILIQPGVIAVSAFFEGFPVQSIGNADFEKVAASAEDFMRTGVRIAGEMGAGPLEQLILETGKNKFIIAPCGDLFLCVYTAADAQLGLIRVVIRSIQAETS